MKERWVTCDGSARGGEERRERGGRAGKGEEGEVRCSVPYCHACVSRNDGCYFLEAIKYTFKKTIKNNRRANCVECDAVDVSTRLYFAIVRISSPPRLSHSSSPYTSPLHSTSSSFHGMSRCVFHIVLFTLALFLSTTRAKPFTYLSYAQIHRRLSQLAEAYPKLIRLYSAQQIFLLPHVGNCTQFYSAEDTTEVPVPCTIWVVELSNFTTLPDHPTRPEVLVSGLLHGDEVIGPHATIAFLEYMVSKYNDDIFVKRMVDTRLTTLIPVTNPVGYYHGERGERQMPYGNSSQLDPNRDFGFNQNPKRCLQTVAARAINELFRIHLFRILITFHGGTNVVSYEWGDKSHCEERVCDPAPDEEIMNALGRRMSEVAGPAASFELEYPVGDMGALVYPVNGGMEDWAYGASWAGQGVECRPETLGGYSKEKVKIEPGAQRCVTFLVETAREKKPLEHTLGGDENMMQKGAPEDGHVPRNVRLLMSAVDVVEPYVVVDEKVVVNKDKMPEVSWGVGGAFIVDGTALQWASADGKRHGISDVMNGDIIYTENGGSVRRFSRAIEGAFGSKSDPIYMRTVAVVDQQYATQPNESVPNVSPQSHLMAARASVNWNFSAGTHKVQGRDIFVSDTFEVSVVDPDVYNMTRVDNVQWGQEEGDVYSLSDSELFSSLGGGHGRGNVVQSMTGMSLPLTIITAVAGVVGILAIALGIFLYARKRRLASRRTQRVKNYFVLTDDNEEEERRALTLADEEAGIDYEEDGQVISASGVRGATPTVFH